MSNENQAKAIAQLAASIERLEKRNHELVDSHNHLSDEVAKLKKQTGTIDGLEFRINTMQDHLNVQ